MNSDLRSDLLGSMAVVAHSLGMLGPAARRAGRGDEMAALEMRLAILRARLRAGSASPPLLAGVRVFIEDFEAFVSRCCG